MSREVYNANDLYVTAVAAPAAEGPDRRRLEVFTPHEPVRLDGNQVYELFSALLTWLISPVSRGTF